MERNVDMDNDYSVEAYLRRMELQKLQRVCQMEDTEILPEVKALALEIFRERTEESKSGKV